MIINIENIEEARSGKGIIEINKDVLWPERYLIWRVFGH